MKDNQHTKSFVIMLGLGFVVLGGYFASTLGIFDLTDAETNPEESTLENEIREAFQLAPKIGKASTVVVIEYGDFQCPACKQSAELMNELLEQYEGDFQYIWVHAPNRDRHPESESAAIAAQCAYEQGYFKPFHDALFENQERLGPELYNELVTTLEMDRKVFSSCLASPATSLVLEKHKLLVSTAQIQETPSYTINNTTIQGLTTLQELEAALKEAQ